jgi:2-hydroxy-3-keto-5-methylthiopentenyl-1-phosphate phosphatase
VSLAVLCDFDGTIVEIDTAVFVLDRFGRGDWRTLDRQYELGQITLEECLRKQFSLVTATREEILDELDKVVTFRQGFERLARYCKEKSIPFIIVSAGLDFVIDHFMRQNGWETLVETCAATTEFKAGGIDFIFPKLFDRASVNFKQDLVKHYRARGMKVVYIGDGTADYTAAASADYPFAVRSSRLAKLCESQRQGCTAITDFIKVVEAISGIAT